MCIISEKKGVVLGMGKSFKHRTWAEVDLDALEYNYKAISSSLTKGHSECKVIGVIKADAYGHGAEACAEALAASGCNAFAVSCTMEALQIRSVVKDAQIIILGYTPPEDADILWNNKITQTVFSLEYARLLSDSVQEYIKAGAIPEGAVIDTHFKLDTGMNRLGFDVTDKAKLVADVKAAASMPGIAAKGLFTHFATADVNCGDNDMTKRQYEGFCEIKELLSENGIVFEDYHACNSAATLWLPQAHMDAVRAGIILFGLSPAGGGVDGLKSVMTLKTTVSHVHTVKKGESISYGGEFVAPRDMAVATLSIGYADGFLRSFAYGGGVRLKDGTFAPVCGRVCMDQCMVDVSGTDTKMGDVVTVFGGDNGESLEALANVANTINYELICLIGKRTPRVYVRSGK